MSQQQAGRESSQPLLPIPIISCPQPLVASTNKLGQLQPRDELEMYKREYNRLVKENSVLLAHLAKVTQEKDTLQAKYNSIQVKHDEQDDKRKRVRRTAGEIVRDFTCFLERCGKSYGTEASLCQHIKLKHPQVHGSKECEEHIAGLRRKTGPKSTNASDVAQDHGQSET